MSITAQIHMAKKALGMDDDTYRDFLKRETGKASSKAMSEAERRRVVEAFRRAGWDGQGPSKRKPLTGKYAPKLQALWIAGWNLGLIADGTDEALITFVRRQTELEHVRFVFDSEDARKVIEALKKWLSRDGGVEWNAPRFRSATDPKKAAVAWAQYRLLVAGATWIGNSDDFLLRIGKMLKREVEATVNLERADWIVITREFGKLVRAAKAQSPFSPLAGEMSAQRTEGGVS